MNRIGDLQKTLTRSIERLSSFVRDQDDHKILSVFAYTGALLDKYLQKESDHHKGKQYYCVFEREVTLYSQSRNTKGLSQLEQQNRIEIIRQIKDILQKYRHLKEETDQQDQTQKINKEKDIDYFNQHLKRIRLLYEEHNIDQVWIQVRSLREKAQTSANIKELISKSEIKDEFIRYQQEYLNMAQFYNIFQQTQGWINDFQDDNAKLQYKVFQEQRTISVRMSRQIQIQMLPFLAIVCQIDLSKYYVPFVQVSVQKRDNFKQKPPRNLKIGFTLTSVPFLADRQCYYYAIGYDRIKTAGSIFILSKSFQEDKQFQQKFNYPINHQDKVFLKVYYFCLEYKPISKTRAKVRIASKVNFQLTFLPLFILRLTAKNFTFDFFKNIVQKAKKFKGSKWQQKVKSNPAMYNFFQSKIDQYFG